MKILGMIVITLGGGYILSYATFACLKSFINFIDSKFVRRIQS